ncbi:MAG: hypothetical protein QMD23_06650 [Candidatus Bathyarchaeia archaeon]|nr:hypothetical protein [Candidatus Bathyarchaeia archaeon]
MAQLYVAPDDGAKTLVLCYRPLASLNVTTVTSQYEFSYAISSLALKVTFDGTSGTVWLPISSGSNGAFVNVEVTICNLKISSRGVSLPSITPSYLYTFIALIAVSSLLLFSFMAYANALRFSSEVRQLKNLMDYVAVETTELITLTLTTNATTQSYLQMPTAIGDKQYWLQLRNDSIKAWLEGGFGNSPIQGAELRVCVPKGVWASGCYVGGYGAAKLECHSDSGVLWIHLTSVTEGD